MSRVLQVLRVALFGPPRVKGNPEQMAALHIYSTERRRVRRQPVNRKGEA